MQLFFQVFQAFPAGHFSVAASFLYMNSDEERAIVAKNKKCFKNNAASGGGPIFLARLRMESTLAKIALKAMAHGLPAGLGMDGTVPLLLKNHWDAPPLRLLSCPAPSRSECSFDQGDPSRNRSLAAVSLAASMYILNYHRFGAAYQVTSVPLPAFWRCNPADSGKPGLKPGRPEA